jgi:hypothetical protein
LLRLALTLLGLVPGIATYSSAAASLDNSAQHLRHAGGAERAMEVAAILRGALAR